MAKTKCVRDTNGDGDCARCTGLGCPVQVFSKVMLDREIMTDTEVAKFRANAERFEYKESWLGTITGYRGPDGTVLLDRCEPR